MRASLQGQPEKRKQNEVKLRLETNCEAQKELKNSCCKREGKL